MSPEFPDDEPSDDPVVGNCMRIKNQSRLRILLLDRMHAHEPAPNAVPDKFHDVPAEASS